MASGNTDLSETLDGDPRVRVTSIELQRLISRGLWYVGGSGVHDAESDIQIEPASDAYFGYYAEQSRQFLSDGGRHATVRTHQDILDAAEQIQRDLESDRNELMRRLKQSISSLITTLPSDSRNGDKMLIGTLNLTARLVLMMEVGTLEHAFTGTTTIVWPPGKSLRQSAEEHFAAPPILLDESVRLEKLFIAHNLSRIAGLEIVWTDNLADHLLLTNDNRKVHIFHHVTFLRSHVTS